MGSYAIKLKQRLREIARVQLFGEVWNLKMARTKVFFELRDPRGAMACSMWVNDFDKLGLDRATLADGAQVVIGGGPDYYEGSGTSSPSFSFLVRDLRVAGEGELLAQLARLRRQLDTEGLFAPQKLLPRPALPRTIGVVTGQSGKARDDVLAGLARRGWRGRVVWAFAPVQDRRAAPAITRALQDLAATGEVDTIVVARGGGSLADMFAFCDETLCRTVALLPVPVISSVGHHTDHTLIDDVSAVCCSTPTHAAEQAVRVHCDQARTQLARAGARLRDAGRRTVIQRARRLSELTRAPAEHLARERRRLHQQLRELRAVGRRQTGARLIPLRKQTRELRAAASRGVGSRRSAVLDRARSLDRRTAAADLLLRRSRAGVTDDAQALERVARTAVTTRGRDLDRVRMALAAHDPERTLARGYALVEDGSGDVVTSTEAAREAGRIAVRFSDGSVDASVEDARQ